MKIEEIKKINNKTGLNLSIKVIIVAIIITFIQISASYGALYRTFAAWGDVGSNDTWPGPTYGLAQQSNIGHMYLFTTLPNTTVRLYAVSGAMTPPTFTQINGGAPIVNQLVPNADTPIEVINLSTIYYPARGIGSADLVNGFGWTYFMCESDQPVCWEINSSIPYEANDRNSWHCTAASDCASFIASQSAGNTSNAQRFIGNKFCTFMRCDSDMGGSVPGPYSTNVDGNSTDPNRGDAFMFFNINNSPVTVSVDYWNGANWVPTGFSVNINANGVYSWGPSSTGRGTNLAVQGAYRVNSSGGDILCYKGDVFSAGTDGDNFFTYGINKADGLQIGTELYGYVTDVDLPCCAGNNNIVITGLNAVATVYIDRFDPATGPVNNLPCTAANGAGTWTQVAGPFTVNPGTHVGWSPTPANTWAPAKGRPFRVRSNVPVQAAMGAKIMEGINNDAKFVSGANTGKPVDVEFWVSSNYANGWQGPPTLHAIAFLPGTIINAPGCTPAIQTTTGPFQGVMFRTIKDVNDIHITSNYPIYLFLESYSGFASSELCSGSENHPVCEMVYAAPPAELCAYTISKESKQAGNNITYTITIYNYGVSDLTIDVWDSIPSGTSYIAGSGNPAPSGTPAWGIYWAAQSITSTAMKQFKFAITGTISDGTLPIINRAYGRDNCAGYKQSEPVANAIVKHNACSYTWKAYAGWANRNASADKQAKINIYALQDNTTINLYEVTGCQPSSTGALTINNQVVNNQPLNAFQKYTYNIPTSATRAFYKITANYPVFWEFDSVANIWDGGVRQMSTYSTDMKVSDKVFITHLTYDKNSSSTNNTNYGDCLLIINPNAVDVTVYINRSLDGGVTWLPLLSQTISANSCWLFGGTDSVSEGEYMVITDSPAGANVMAIRTNELHTSYNSDTPYMYGISPTGRKIVGAGQALYGVTTKFNGRIIITGIGTGTANYEVDRYVPSTTSGLWTVGGASGTWTTFASGSVAAGTQSVVNNTNNNEVVRVRVTGGTASVQAIFGGIVSHTYWAGDGDYIPGQVRAGFDWLAQGGTGSHLYDWNFLLSTNGSNNDFVFLLVPDANTHITIDSTDMQNNGPDCGVNYGTSNYTSTAPDQVFAFWYGNMNAANKAISSADNPIYAMVMDDDVRGTLFSGAPLVCTSPTNTPTITPTLPASPTITPTITRTRTPTITNTITMTLTPTLTPNIVVNLAKSIDKGVVMLGDNITYCLTYTNPGPQVATFNIWDTIPWITDFVGCSTGTASSTCTVDTYGTTKVVRWTITNLAVGNWGFVCFWVKVSRLPYLIDGKEYYAMIDDEGKVREIKAEEMAQIWSKEKAGGVKSP